MEVYDSFILTVDYYVSTLLEILAPPLGRSRRARSS